jgi:hypothetical protein
VAKGSWLQKIKGSPTALERIKMLRDNKWLFVPRIEYGLALGLLVAFFGEGTQLFITSSNSEFLWNLTWLPEAALLTIAFTLTSMMFLPFFFVRLLAKEQGSLRAGLVLVFQVLKFLVAAAIGYFGYQMYGVRGVTYFVFPSAVSATVMVLLLAAALLLAYLMIAVLFAYPFFSKNTNFLLVELVLIIFFVSCVATLYLTIALNIALAALLVIPVHKITSERCPACGAARKRYMDIFKCSTCGHETYRSLFSNIP